MTNPTARAIASVAASAAAAGISFAAPPDASLAIIGLVLGLLVIWKPNY
jgi:hypothetical protein